jgi:hypothetical protein
MCIRGCRKALDGNLKRLLEWATARTGFSLHPFFGQAVLGPIVTASARKKRAIQHPASHPQKHRRGLRPAVEYRPRPPFADLPLSDVNHAGKARSRRRPGR